MLQIKKRYIWDFFMFFVSPLSRNMRARFLEFETQTHQPNYPPTSCSYCVINDQRNAAYVDVMAYDDDSVRKFPVSSANSVPRQLNDNGLDQSLNVPVAFEICGRRYQT